MACGLFRETRGVWLGSGIQGQDKWDEDDADDHGDEYEWSADFDEVAEL